MDPQYTREYENFERRHWWFVVRREIILRAFARFVPKAREGRWLDVGCGTGVLLEACSSFRERVGAEVDPRLAAKARQRGLDVRQIDSDWDFSTFGRFDCISLCDVLEHVEDDRAAIAAVYKCLNDDGILLLTVPALKSLWSDHDVVNHHYRRYRRHELAALFSDNQWEIRQLSYFCTILLPMVWATRQIKSIFRRFRPGAVAASDLKFGPPAIDAALGALFRLEKPLLKRVNLPIGSSLLLVARKKPARQL